MKTMMMKDASLFAANDFLPVPEHIICGTVKDESAYKHYDSFSVTGIKANHIEIQVSRRLSVDRGSSITFKLFGVIVRGEVVYHNTDTLRIAVRVQFCSSVKWEMSHQLLMHTSYTPQQLNESGIACTKVKSYLEFGFCSSQEEYEQVLRLRRQTYSEVDKMEVDRPLDQLRYFFDDYSDILVVRHHGKVVGSAAIIHGNGRDKKFEVQKFMEDSGDFSIHYNEKMLEVAALCVLKDYRKTDLVHGVFEHLCYEMMKHKKDHIIASSDEILAKTYKTIGFMDTGRTFTQPKYQDLYMHVLIVSKDAALKARNVGFLHWWPIWGEIVKHMQEKSIVKIGFADSISLLIREFSYKAYRLITH